MRWGRRRLERRPGVSLLAGRVPSFSLWCQSSVPQHRDWTFGSASHSEASPVLTLACRWCLGYQQIVAGETGGYTRSNGTLRTRHESIMKRFAKLFLIVLTFACGIPALAQYLGPVGSPLPIQQRPTATTGIVRNYGSAFPTGSYRPPGPTIQSPSYRSSSYKSPVTSMRSSVFSTGDSLGMRVANEAKWQGIMRGIRF